ncbi:nuclear receptor-interacting protein 2 isoform X4 [Willisornis vidua]|uniref:Nuclear receptor-interacting protein 2 isoform X4 n=1 Tax=Willisornis vidua TaxID=1566151 RepID=A0ABQ9DS14_9PASS|nr:nuclear receptor-interacting protein 2 isoform X4 [Willisornis vidua]
MSTRKSCPLPLGQGDQEEKQNEGTPNLERQECEMELRNKAILQQKRRLKQATQFVHKDSADLLPLDGLTRLGTSKDLAVVNENAMVRLEEMSAMDCGDLSLPIPSVVGRVEEMELQFGQETVLCSALVVDDEMLEFCIGLQTLWSLKDTKKSPILYIPDYTSCKQEEETEEEARKGKAHCHKLDLCCLSKADLNKLSFCFKPYELYNLIHCPTLAGQEWKESSPVISLAQG